MIPSFYTYLLFLFLFAWCMLCVLVVISRSVFFCKKKDEKNESNLEPEHKKDLNICIESNTVELERNDKENDKGEMITKYETHCVENLSKIRFGIVGQFQSGKSLLINCLLKRSVATVGVGMATTHTVVNYLFSIDKEYVEYIDDKGKHNLPISEVRKLDTLPSVSVVNVYINNELLKYYTLTDMPGLGFDDKDNEAAIKAIDQIDFAIVVTSNHKSIGGSTSSAYKDIEILMRYKVPYYIV